MTVKNISPALRDAGRLNTALIFPEIITLVCGFLAAVLFFLVAPVFAFGALGVLGFILCRLVRGRSVFATLLLTLLLSLAWLIGAAGSLAGSLYAMAGALIMLFPVGLCWRAVPAVIRLRKTYGKTFRCRGTISRWRIPHGPRMLSLLLNVFGLLFLSGLGMVAMFFGAVIGKGAGAGFALRPFAGLINARYRRVLQILAMRAQELRARDTRPGILLLHSFVDDDLAVERPLRLFSSVLQVKLSLEELIVERIWQVGPVFAIGKPKEIFSPLGAAREYLEGDLWQPEVNARLLQSAAVVSVLGDTEGILWEYRRVSECQKPLLIVVPPATAAVVLGRWKNFCTAFPQAAAVALPPDGKSLPLLAWFPLTGQAKVWMCEERNETAYTLAFDDFVQDEAKRIGSTATQAPTRAESGTEVSHQS